MSTIRPTIPSPVFAVYALPWLPTALLALQLKLTVLQQRGFFLAARLTDQTSLEPSLVERLAFFSRDLFILFLLIPLLLVLAGSLLPPRLRAPSVAAVAIAFALFFYINGLAVSQVGRYLSAAALHDALRWGVGHHQYIGEYVTTRGLLKVVLVVVAIIAAAYWAQRHDPTIHPARRPRWVASVTAFGLLSLNAGGLAVAGLSHTAHTPLHADMLTQTIAGFIDVRESGPSVSGLDVNGLVASFERVSESTPTANRGPHWGAARNSDVLFFVFETGPHDSLAIEGELDGFPTLKRLRETAFVGQRHYTTYPYTSHALFSLFSGLYPPSLRPLKRFVSSWDENTPLPGVMQSFNRSGYTTAVYSPYVPRLEEDERMFRQLGIQRQIIAERLHDVRVATGDWQLTRRLDQASLAQMKSDLSEWISAGQRFAVAFLPQVGHAPWYDVANNGNDYRARGRALMAIQDAWLGEIVDLLEQRGRLSQTIIVVTGDHGTRTRLEDPTLRGGMIDDHSFHVPFLLFSARAFGARTTVPWLTSHIDVSPSIQELLGIRNGGELQQGAALWDPRLADRTTFFLGEGYLGADGFHSRGRFAMLNWLSGLEYAANDMRFRDADVVPGDSAEGREIRQRLGMLEAVQRRLLTELPKLHLARSK